MQRRFRNLVQAVLAAANLGACTTTTILTSENPSSERPPQWTDYSALPVELHGAVTGLSQADLAAMFPTPQPAATGAGRRVVLYLNPAAPMAQDRRCQWPGDFRPGGQSGSYASLTGALCDGSRVITTATAQILTAQLTPDQVRGHLEMMHTQLYQALTYGNNHPDQRFPGRMYGP